MRRGGVALPCTRAGPQKLKTVSMIVPAIAAIFKKRVAYQFLRDGHGVDIAFLSTLSDAAYAPRVCMLSTCSIGSSSSRPPSGQCVLSDVRRVLRSARVAEGELAALSPRGSTWTERSFGAVKALWCVGRLTAQGRLRGCGSGGGDDGGDDRQGHRIERELVRSPFGPLTRSEDSIRGVRSLPPFRALLIDCSD